MRRLLLPILAAGCVKDQPPPFVGECADYPQGVYEYGLIGIGTCLSGPVDVQFAGDPDDPVILVTNANPYAVFDEGSLLSIPWSSVDLDAGKQLVHEMSAEALPLPSYPAGLAVSDDLAMVGVRLSDGARTRADNDDVWLVDLANPASPQRSDRGTDNTARVEVQADPIDVVFDDATGLAFVANRTAHSITVLDTTEPTIQVVPPWPEREITEASFDDADDDGSTASLADLSIEDEDQLVDDTWILSWLEGSWQIWMPDGGGLRRTTYIGGDSYDASALGLELDPEDYGTFDSFDDPFYVTGDPGVLYFSSAGSLYVAVTDGYLGDWSVEGDPLLSPDEEGESFAAPAVITDDDGGEWVFYERTLDGSSSIEVQIATDGVFLDAPVTVLEADLDHEAEGIGDPHVFFDIEEDRYRMFYTAFDGQRYSIGHATSTDLITWDKDADPILEADDVDYAAPVVSALLGRYRMWVARDDGAGWTIAEARSRAGYAWTDLGTVMVPEAAPIEPPGPAIGSNIEGSFRVEGLDGGGLLTPMQPGIDYETALYGWSARAVVGYHLDAGVVGTDSQGGVRLDSISESLGLAWLTLTDRNGNQAIGVAELDGEDLDPDAVPILEAGDSGFDQGGVHTPVVAEIDGTWHMYYAGVRGARTSIGLATSDDGITWERQGQVLATGQEWDSVSVEPGSVQVTDDGEIRLWYTGGDGEELRIGSALSDDGVDFVREDDGSREWQLASGAPGEWDDSGVRDPWLVEDEDGQHLFYAGFDGEVWRIGHALRATEGDDWERASDAVTDETRPVADINGQLFYADGLVRPVAERTDAGWNVWYAGIDQGVERVGLMFGRQPERLHKIPKLPSLGDQLRFGTQKGDEDIEAIPLDIVVEEATLNGVGVIALSLDEERGMLYAASRENPYIFAIDVRDDSTPGFDDLNYLDIEAAIVVNTSSGATGFRQILPVPDTDIAYAINDSPESIMILDLSRVVDDEFSDLVFDDVIGWLEAPRAFERDAGVNNEASVGPAQMLLHPDGRRLFVTNYNRNSISLYDLSLGTYGKHITDVELVGEAPYGIALHPDGDLAVFANYLGEAYEDELTSSTLGVLDVDPDSPTYLEVITWIGNL